MCLLTSDRVTEAGRAYIMNESLNVTVNES
jgi:hypothetical protein